MKDLSLLILGFDLFVPQNILNKSIKNIKISNIKTILKYYYMVTKDFYQYLRTDISIIQIKILTLPESHLINKIEINIS